MKIVKLLLAPLLLFFIYACSDSDDHGFSDSNQNLVSIKKEYYTNGNLVSSEKRNFYKKKLIYIQYSDGSYDDIYYEENLISRILEFDVNNQLEWTTEFNYDNLGRLIEKKVVPGPDNPISVSRQKDITYNGNKITSELSWSDGGFMKNVISLNASGLIAENKFYYQDDSLMQFSNQEYSNGNLTKVVNKASDGSVVSEATINYSSESISEYYIYYSYLYGNEWKNNYYLTEQFGLEYRDFSMISEHYIRDYHLVDSQSNFSIDATYDYTFDSNGRITKQTENGERSDGFTFKIVCSFEYR